MKRAKYYKHFLDSFENAKRLPYGYLGTFCNCMQKTNYSFFGGGGGEVMSKMLGISQTSFYNNLF